MRNKRAKFLSFILTLVMILRLLPGMSLTAYAVEKSETISLIKVQNPDAPEMVTSVTSEHFKVTAGYMYINDFGLTVNQFGAMTIESLNGENITKIELSYAWSTNASTVSVTPGTLNDAYNTISDINATKVTVSSSHNAGVRFNSVKIYYSSTDVDVTGVTLSPNTTQTIKVGENVAFTATVSPDDATYKNVTWTTDDATVATVTNGVVTAVGKGTATITATATNGTDSTLDDKTATCTVTVHAHELTNYQAYGATITATCANSDGLCTLTDSTSTLTILAPTAGGGTAVLSGDVSAFGVSSSNIKYAVKSDSDWGEESSTAPSGSGFFKASITVSKDTTASVTYGVSAITVASGIEHGTVTAPDVATVDAVVPLTITPEVGYELDELRPTKTNGGGLISVHTDDDDNKSFIMPDEEVTVTATFKLKDYKISFYITSGSVTVPETANYENTVRLVISPDEGYGVLSFGIDGVNDWVLVSKDTDTGVEVYTFTMPAQDVSLDVKFAETTIYTIFYKADSTVNSILYRFSSGDAGFKMKSDTKIDDTACWGGQMRGVKGRTSFPISFNINSSYWGVLQDYNVVDNPSSLSSMGNGSAILVEGDDKAFVAQFMWGFYDTDESGELVLREDYGTKYYFVTANTTSISVPNPTRRGYNFGGWSYTNSNDEMVAIDAATGSTTVAIKDNIDKTTIFGAIWKRATSTVTYDLNGGSWSNSNTASVTYGEKLPQPTAPTKDAYAFNGWIVKSKARAIKGSQEVTLTAGSNFDFDTTKITENITLQAAWKHVHSYVNVPLSKVNDLLPGAMPQEYITNYGQYVHFSICSLADDFHLEGHTFDKNGKCACGAERPVEEVTLQETYGDLNMVIQSKPKKDSEVILNAPVMDTKQFVKWEYRSLNGSTWHDLVSTPVVGFIIPDSLRVHAVYESLTEPKLTLKAERYSTDGLLFTMQYALPQGWKATNAAVVYGDNHMLRYMKVVRSNTSWYSITDPFFGIEIVSAGTETVQ